MNRQELKPCPFCGAEAEVIRVGHEHDPRYAVICKDQIDCWAGMAPESAWWITKDGAKNAWNQRHKEEA